MGGQSSASCSGAWTILVHKHVHMPGCWLTRLRSSVEQRQTAVNEKAGFLIISPRARANLCVSLSRRVTQVINDPPPPPHPPVLPHTHRHAHRGEGCTGQRAPPENEILSCGPPSGHLAWASMWNGEETAWKRCRLGEPSGAASVLVFASASVWGFVFVHPSISVHTCVQAGCVSVDML